MESAQLKARIEAARRFEHTFDAVRLTVRVPSEHEMRVYAARARAAGASDTATLMVEILRSTLLNAVQGWQGVTVDHFLHDGDAEGVDFDAELVAPLFDANPDWAEPLVTAIQSRVLIRRDRTEAAAKN